MKRIFAFILCLAVISMASFTAIASSENNVVAEKKALRRACLSNNDSFKINMDEGEREAKKEEIYKNFLSGYMNIDKFSEELEKLGVYTLQSSIADYKIIQSQQRSSPTPLDYNNIIVSYDRLDDNWELCGGVWWTDNSWSNDFAHLDGLSYGDNVNIGGLNGLGISLYDLSGSFSGCYLEDTWIYVTDGGGNISTTTHSPTGNVDSRYGVFHQFQDYAQYRGTFLGVDNYIYYGKHMSIFAEYSAEFENYHGRARLQYVHTWEESSITSVGVNFQVGVDSIGAGFNISYNYEQHKFETLSPGETLF